ncbi:MAG: hypothetical protein WA862_01105 [Solirubrobacterales bacterium]
MKPFGKTMAMLAVTAFLVAGIARAEVVQRGNLRITVGAELSPQRLPRAGAAPIAVTVGGRIATTDDGLPPQLKSLRIELNRHARLETAGLPRCRESQIQPASTARALAACRAALVGQGDFSVDVVLGTQQAYPAKGRLLVFNGTYEGRPALLGQIYSAHPFGNSFVIPFAIGKLRRGRFGTTLTAKLPRSFTDWGYLTGLTMRLGRRYLHEGRRHSVLSSGCPAPEGFPGATFPLARASFGFSTQKIGVTLTRSCEARG